MTAVFSLILSFYCLLVVAFLVGWVRIRRQPMPQRSASPSAVSVVVAVRNEEENVQTLIRDLSAMAYPREKFEVIIVNDHSTDATAEKARLSLNEFSNARLFDLPDGKQGKKAALQLGIEHARFGVIATTDADCTASKNWLTCLSSYFEWPDTQMLIGAVKLSGGDSFFSKLQVMEFVSLAGSTAASVGLGHPVMCNGANLAFRKEVFAEVGGYEGNLSIPSGDDEFLMRKIYKRYPNGIKFLNYFEAVVSSRPQRTIHDFFHQRLRWAGKWKQNKDSVAQLLAVFIVVAQLSFVALLIKTISVPDAAVGFILLKFALEGIFIFWVGRFLDRRFNILVFLTLQLIYPLYVAVVGVFSLFSAYRWKSRNYK